MRFEIVFSEGRWVVNRYNAMGVHQEFKTFDADAAGLEAMCDYLEETK